MGESVPPFDWMEEYNGQLYAPLSAKRKVRPRKMEFVGWGSRPLIEFLESIGMDTTTHISQYDVTAIINKYVNDHNLHHPTKKKRILCDQGLLSLFGRKTISRIRIYDMLETHFAENQVDSDDDFFSSSEEEDSACEPQKHLTADRKLVSKKRVLEAPKSCFVAVIADNIKRIYLKRSLVQQLLKYPETFEQKIVGSFVRIKSDPNDYLQKNSHLLVQVLGLKKASGANDKCAEMLLQVSNFIKDVPISFLSDDNFSEEECEDLRQRVRDGLLNRPTIVEVEQKVRVLHEDITKHWLWGELDLLQKLIDRANEKGWRKACTLSEYLEKRQLLQTPDEQTRLLHEVPKIIADEIEIEATEQDFPDNTKHGSHSSPKSILTGGSENPICDITADKTSSTWISFSTDSAGKHAALVTSGQNNGIVTTATHLQDCRHNVLVQEHQKQSTEIHRESNADSPSFKVEENNRSEGLIDLQVIDLSDDEEDPNGVQILNYDPESTIWHYVDPQGDIQGPFSMASLKRWKDCDYFPPDFKVWRTGQAQKEAVLLIDVLHGVFAN